MATLEIKSHLPGVFYRAAAPGAPAFKADGDDVTDTDIIGVVEVMKTFQEVFAGVSGGKIKFLVENEEPIMPGQVIAEVEQ